MNHREPYRARVSIQRLQGYHPDEVRGQMAALIHPLGGMEAYVGRGSHVVLKPNFLRPASPDRAITTHPEIIRAVAELVRNTEPSSLCVTDSSGIGTARRCAIKSGLDLEHEGFAVVNPDDAEDVDSDTSHFQRLKISRRMRTSTLVNLPKVKTHGQMVLTGAVKNCFGAVVGIEKVQWHMRVGRDPMAFARFILHVHDIVKPVLHIVDGVVGMEGNGPGSGTPRSLGVIMASDNAHALDLILAEILDIPPMSVYTLRAAHEAGLLPPKEHIEIIGPTVDELKVKRKWALARPVLPRMMLRNEWLASLLERNLKVAPKITRESCTLCEACIDSCAVGAMTCIRNDSAEDSGKIAIDKDTCISCFCCQEMCPSGAITVEAGFLARALRLGLR